MTKPRVVFASTLRVMLGFLGEMSVKKMAELSSLWLLLWSTVGFAGEGSSSPEQSAFTSFNFGCADEVALTSRQAQRFGGKLSDVEMLYAVGWKKQFDTVA